jgi:hypothetical protein
VLCAEDSQRDRKTQIGERYNPGEAASPGDFDSGREQAN